MTKYLISFFIIFLVSCSPRTIQVKENAELKFEKTPEYHVNLDAVVKPSSPNFIYGTIENNKVLLPEGTKVSDNKVVVLTSSELNKISQLVDLSILYKDIIYKQEDLINTDINTINSLKEFVEIEKMKSCEYEKMWVNSENSYREEQFQRKTDNFLSRTVQVLLSFGIIVIALQ